MMATYHGPTCSQCGIVCATQTTYIDNRAFCGNTCYEAYRLSIIGDSIQDARSYIAADPVLTRIEIEDLIHEIFDERIAVNEEVLRILRSLQEEGRMLHQDAQQKRLGIAIELLEGVSTDDQSRRVEEEGDEPHTAPEDGAAGGSG